MKFHTTVKIVLVSSVIFLCTGFALYSFFRLSIASEQNKFNLYTLVPSTASAVFITEDVNSLISEIENLSCSRDGHYLYFSKIFSSLKRSLHEFTESVPHGISPQMNQILLSFHEPINERNQILYCRLGIGDQDLVDHFIQTHFESAYSPKIFPYKGKKIYIYSTDKGDFIACYRDKEFLALSYQKRLIEEVIDAQRTGESLANDINFKKVSDIHKNASSATLYKRMSSKSSWIDLDIKMKGDFIYLSGTGQETDTCMLGHTLRSRTSIEGFVGDALPSTTCYFSRQGVRNWTSFLNYCCKTDSSTIKCDTIGYDNILSDYLIENACKDLTVCSFYSHDSSPYPATVIRIPVYDRAESEKRLYSLANSLPLKVNERKSTRISWLYFPDRAYPVYSFPSVKLFTNLSSFSTSSPLLYAAFYGDELLLSSSHEELSDYIRYVEKNEVLEHTLDYNSGIDGLASSYLLMLMTDLDILSSSPKSLPSFMPKFIFDHVDFFRHFTLFTQFTSANEGYHSYIILKYKGKNRDKEKSPEKTSMQ